MDIDRFLLKEGYSDYNTPWSSPKISKINPRFVYFFSFYLFINKKNIQGLQFKDSETMFIHRLEVLNENLFKIEYKNSD